jgi:biotin transporter BioY
MAYPFAAYAVGWLAERGWDRRYVTAVCAMASGLAIVFAGGVGWLALAVEPARGLGAALAAGLYPFIVADLLKLLVAAGLTPGLWWLLTPPRER